MKRVEKSLAIAFAAIIALASFPACVKVVPTGGNSGTSTSVSSSASVSKEDTDPADSSASTETTVSTENPASTETSVSTEDKEVTPKEPGLTKEQLTQLKYYKYTYYNEYSAGMSVECEDTYDEYKFPTRHYSEDDPYSAYTATWVDEEGIRVYSLHYDYEDIDVSDFIDMCYYSNRIVKLDMATGNFIYEECFNGNTVDRVYGANKEISKETYTFPSEGYVYTYEYEYDEAGNTIKYTFDDSTYKTVYTYVYSDGKKTEENYNNGNGEEYTKYYSYDEKGNLVKVQFVDKDKDYCCEAYEYSDKDKVLESYFYNSEGDYNSVTYVYDDSDNVVETVSTNQFSDYVYITKSVYEYDSEGRVTLCEYYNRDENEVFKLSSRARTGHDEKGNTSFYSYESLWGGDYEYNYVNTYDDRDRVTKVEAYSGSTLVEITEYEYFYE